MDCTKPIRLLSKKILHKYPDGLEVPCGKCLNCRLQKKREWTVRMLHETTQHNDSIFITLTYSDECIPENESLRKDHAVKFIKRLRFHVNKNCPGRRIRYFLCGEYGDKTQRPHYHAIIFGLGLNSLDKSFVIDSWPYCEWTTIRIKKSFGLAEGKSIQYVAGYIQKKLSGELADEVYRDTGRENVFRLLSLGLGRGYIDNNVDTLTDNLYITVQGVKMALPRYYLNRLNLDCDSKTNYAIDKELETVKEISGYELTRDEAYRCLPASEIIKIERTIKLSNKQKELNKQSRFDMCNKKL